LTRRMCRVVVARAWRTTVKASAYTG
jgi:hypothetical protein